MIRWPSGKAKPNPPERRRAGAKGLRALLRLTGWTVAVAAVVCLLGVVALVTVPKALGWQGVVVLSGSMEPALQTGGIAFVQPLKDPTTIKTGEIITFTSPDFGKSRVTHRVVEVVQGNEGLQFRTKGDANSIADPTLTPATKVIGTVKFDVPYLGYLVDKLRQRQNFYLYIGLPAALLILNELYSIATELRKPKELSAEAPQETEGAAT